MLEFDLENGKLTIELEKPINYAKDGKYIDGNRIICSEPVQSSAVDCLRLAQVLNRIQVGAVKSFFGDKKFTEGDKDNAVGQEVIPFYKQKTLDKKKLIEEAKNVVTMLISSDVDPFDLLNIGRKILTTRYSSKIQRRLCIMDDDAETAFTSSMFGEMVIEDQLFIIGAYSTFFGIGLTGQKKTSSVKPS